MIDCWFIGTNEEQGTTELMEERIIDTVEAYQALEAVVTRKGHDYVDPGTSHGNHWFTDWDDIYLEDTDRSYEIPTAYSCILGHWMGEIGVPVAEAYSGNMPHTWDLMTDGRVAYDCATVRVARGVGRLLADVPTWNDNKVPWGVILERVRARAFGANIAITAPVEEVAFV